MSLKTLLAQHSRCVGVRVVWRVACLGCWTCTLSRSRVRLPLPS